MIVATTEKGTPASSIRVHLGLLLLRRRAGVVVAWIFNLWGAADILNAFYQANHAGLLAGQLGAAYFLPTLIVPLLLITHGLAFRILLGHEKESVINKIRQPAQSAVGQF